MSIDDVARRIGVVTTTVRRHLIELQLSGLKKVNIGGGTRLVRFTEESLNRMIKRAAERDEPLIKDNARRQEVGVDTSMNI